MISLLLILFYGTVLCYWLLKISRSYRNYLSTRQVILSFTTKVAFGVAYGFLFWKLYKGDDTWQYHNFSLIEYQDLLKHPANFFNDIRTKTSGNSSLSSIYNTKNSIWNNLDDVLLIKVLTIFNLFSFGHYYVNVVLFCFIIYIGHLLLFRLLVRYQPTSRPLVIIALFYNPMIVFWLSGIRKEGLIFLGLAMVLYYFDQLLRKQGNIVASVGLFVLGLGIVFLMRSFILMCLAPALIAWFLCTSFRWNSAVTFGMSYAVCILLFFMSSNIPQLPDLPAKVTERQYEFFSLTANTRLATDSLKGTPISFLKILPQAFNHSFLRPYLTESKGMLQFISALDVLWFYLIFLTAAVFRKDNWRQVIKHPLTLTFLLTSLFAYLIIGYIVPFPGAFVRYKSVFEVLFTCVAAAVINYDKLKAVVIIKK